MNINSDLLINSKINGDLTANHWKCKNIAPASGENKVTNGITFTNTNGVISASGTATADVYYQMSSPVFVKAGVTYTLSANFSVYSSRFVYSNYYANIGLTYNDVKWDTGTSKSFTPAKDGWIDFCVYVHTGNGLNESNLKFQVEEGNQRTSYTPHSYGNNDLDKTILSLLNTIRVNNGVKPGVALNMVESINLYDYHTDTIGSILSPTGAVTATSGYRVSTYIPVEPGKQYTISWDFNSAATQGEDMMRVGYYDAAKNFISRPNSSTHPYTITTPNNCYFVRLSYSYTSGNVPINTNVAIQAGTSASYNSGYIPKLYLNEQLIYTPVSVNNVTMRKFSTAGTAGNIAFVPRNLAEAQRLPILLIGTQNGHADKIFCYLIILNKDSFTSVSLGNGAISTFASANGALVWHSNNYSSWTAISAADFELVRYF